MKRRTAYVVSRSRDRKGKIIKQELKPYTMCVHTFCGGGYESMAVLVAEIVKYETEDTTGNQDGEH